MAIQRTITRRLAACLGGISLVAGLAITAAGGAQAAVPDKWGFAYVSSPAVPGTPDLAHQAGSWPAPLHAHSAPGPANRVFVTFPRLASKNGVVHVTAVNQGPVWCQALGWAATGLDERVGVRCYKAGGAPVFSPFTVTYTTSTKGPFPAGRAYGYVRFQPGAGIAATFNSVGGANSVTAGPTGVWTVRMPGLGSAVPAGGVQVTAVNPAAAAKCEVAAWGSSSSGEAFRVRCYDGGTTPLKTGWTLSYQRKRAITGAQPKLFAYTFDNKPGLPGPYAPAPPGVNFNSASAVNTVMSAGLGLRLVQFPHVGLLQNTVLVSGFNVGPGFCNLLTLWATSAAAPNVTVRDVACYTAAGAHKNEASLITYTSAH